MNKGSILARDRICKLLNRTSGYNPFFPLHDLRAQLPVIEDISEIHIRYPRAERDPYRTAIYTILPRCGLKQLVVALAG
jgi:hypothetical protein